MVRMSTPQSILLFMILLLPISVFAYAQQTSPAQPVITIVSIKGNISYSRTGWTTPQALAVGSQLYSSDLIYPEANAELDVVCPDGNSQHFSAEMLFPNDVIQCPINP